MVVYTIGFNIGDGSSVVYTTKTIGINNFILTVIQDAIVVYTDKTVGGYNRQEVIINLNYVVYTTKITSNYNLFLLPLKKPLVVYTIKTVGITNVKSSVSQLYTPHKQQVLTTILKNHNYANQLYIPLKLQVLTTVHQETPVIQSLYILIKTVGLNNWIIRVIELFVAYTIKTIGSHNLLICKPLVINILHPNMSIKNGIYRVPLLVFGVIYHNVFIPIPPLSGLVTSI